MLLVVVVWLAGIVMSVGSARVKAGEQALEILSSMDTLSSTCCDVWSG